MFRKTLLTLLSVCPLVLTSSPALAAVSGTVLTPDGVAVEGARVEVAQPAGGPSARTGRQGDFSLPDVDPPVLLLITHTRFEDRPIQVEEGRTEPLEVTLQPRQEVFDEIVVSATRDPGGGFQPVSVAATAAKPTDKPAPPSTVMDVIEGTPSVAESGQGGHFQTFSVRGIAGQRILTMVSGARIVTERRAGVSLSFIEPLLLNTVDVVRGPSSSYYGSGALGGVVQAFPRRYEQLHFDVGYAGAGDERYAVAGIGDTSEDGSWSVAAAHRRADDSETPDGLRLFSRFEQSSAALEKRWTTDGGTEWEIVALPSVGRDIGKPNNEFPERTTLYPKEDHLIFKVGARKPGVYRIDLWAHPNQLETRVRGESGPDRLNLVDNEAFDFGANVQWELSLPWSTEGRLGVEYFGRRDVTAIEELTTLDGDVLDRRTTLDGTEDQAAAYGSVRRPFGPVTVQAGTRLSWIQQDNVEFDTLDDTAWSGFVGATVPVADGLELAANVGTGLRFPTLSERFFTGTTGRGEVISNTDLDPERSVSGDAGLRYFGDRVFVSGYVFRNEIDDYIERIPVEPGVRTFVNLTSGTIEGIETDGFVQATDALRIGWRGQWLDGESDAGEQLADIPQDRITLEGTYDVGHWILDGRLQHRFEKDRPGPGEQVSPEAQILSASVTYMIRDGFSVSLTGKNLLDETYLPSADDRAVPAKERSIGIGLRWVD